ncbi:MAG: Rieske (2Fe-2S) protein [Gemmatimonadaceae bacterium]|jgi:nitrite reductase/ring-hydroxylating ferredoxin subunit|nr:Rieske (2Fe-2S) protein [Gemmatimonadaceae bacterium]
MPDHFVLPSDPCAGDDACDRRAFLRRGAAVVAGLAALGLTADDALALPVSHVTGLASHSGETASYPIPAKDGVLMDDKRDVILARHKGIVTAFLLVCPHKGTNPLDWSAAKNEFICPKHKSRFQPSGMRIEGKADRAMDRYAVSRQGNMVVVALDRIFEQDKDAAGWAAAQLAV